MGTVLSEFGGFAPTYMSPLNPSRDLTLRNPDVT